MYRFELARGLYRNAESGGGKEFFKTESVFEEDNPFSRYRNRSIISRAANIPMRQKLIGNGKAQRTRHMRQALTPIHAPWRCFSPFGDYSGQIDPKLLIDGVSTLRQGVAIVVQIQRSDLNQFSRNSHPEFTGKMVVAETCFFKFRRNRDLRLWGDLVRKGDRKPSGRALPVSGRTMRVFGQWAVRSIACVPGDQFRHCRTSAFDDLPGVFGMRLQSRQCHAQLDSRFRFSVYGRSIPVRVFALETGFLIFIGLAYDKVDLAFFMFH